MLAVDVIDVSIGMPADSAVGSDKQFAALAVDQTVLWAGLHTSRGSLLMRIPLIRAERTLADLGRPNIVIFVRRHLEGTGDHAIAATHTLVWIVGHRPVRLFAHRSDQAGGYTRRIIAVHAVHLDEDWPALDIAVAGGRNVGYLVSAITPDGTGGIESIYIENDFRGQAIGDRLMRKALDWLDSMKVHTRLIDVAVGNERAYKFYARFGFYPRVVTLKQRLKDE